MRAVCELIRAFYRTRKSKGFTRLWVDESSGEVEVVKTYQSLDDALEASKGDFCEFADACEETCGEPPTCLYEQLEFITDANGPGAAIRWRPAKNDRESLYPVMEVELEGETECFTVESISQAASSPASC